MTTLLSSISGQFSKALILGAFFPAVLFVVLGFIFLNPYLTPSLPLVSFLQTLDPQWQVVAIGLISILLSGILFNLNIPIIQMYEGYPWLNTSLGIALQRQKQTQLDTLTTRYRRLLSLLHVLPPVPPDRPNAHGHFKAVQDEWTEIVLKLHSDVPIVYPVLPTRLGNVIRSFEEYAYREYKIEAITVWNRLIAKIDKDYAMAIEEAKTSFDFMLNCSVLSALLSAFILLAGLLSPASLGSLASWLLLVALFALFALLSYYFYVQSIFQARMWGDTVKGAFDLYRAPLLEQLGYKHRLTTRQEERQLWERISLQMSAGDQPYYGPRLDYTESAQAFPKTFITRSFETPALELVRGLRPLRNDGIIKVLVGVKNNSPPYDPRRIMVTDTLPDGSNTFGDLRAFRVFQIRPTLPSLAPVSTSSTLARSLSIKRWYSAIMLCGRNRHHRYGCGRINELVTLAHMLQFRERRPKMNEDLEGREAIEEAPAPAQPAQSAASKAATDLTADALARLERATARFEQLCEQLSGLIAQLQQTANAPSGVAGEIASGFASGLADKFLIQFNKPQAESDLNLTLRKWRGLAPQMDQSQAQSYSTFANPDPEAFPPRGYHVRIRPEEYPWPTGKESMFEQPDDVATEGQQPASGGQSGEDYSLDIGATSLAGLPGKNPVPIPVPPEPIPPNPTQPKETTTDVDSSGGFGGNDTGALGMS